MEDLFNPEILALSTGESYKMRKAVRALYTVNVKSMAWEIVEWLDATYEWTRGKGGTRVSFSFKTAFEELLGEQLRSIKALRHIMCNSNVVREDHKQDTNSQPPRIQKKKKRRQNETSRITQTINREVQDLAELRPAICQRFEDPDARGWQDLDGLADADQMMASRETGLEFDLEAEHDIHLSPIFGNRWLISTWEAEKKPHALYVPLQAGRRLELAMVSRDKKELEKLSQEEVPEHFEPYSRL